MIEIIVALMISYNFYGLSKVKDPMTDAELEVLIKKMAVEQKKLEKDGGNVWVQ